MNELSASTHAGETVKAGDKVASLVGEVIKYILDGFGIMVGLDRGDVGHVCRNERLFSGENLIDAFERQVFGISEVANVLLDGPAFAVIPSKNENGESLAHR